MQHVFVYGTLQLPGIVEKLTGKSFNIIPSVLPGFKCYCVKDSDYPAIVEKKNAETKGLLLENTDDISLDVIAFYEGEEYEIQRITVLADGKTLPAIAFVWAKGVEFLENRDWDILTFEKECLEHYLKVLVPETLSDFKKK